MSIPNKFKFNNRLAPRGLPALDVREVRRGLSPSDPECATTWIEVENWIFVEPEYRAVVELDWEGSECRPLTTDDVERWDLWDYYTEDDYDDEGELITEFEDFE